MRLCWVWFVFILGLGSASAQTLDNQRTLWQHVTDGATVQVGIGQLSGVSHELVYGNDQQVSELIWRLQEVPMLGLSASFALPYGMTLRAEGWTKINVAPSYMEDFDWDTDKHPTDWAYYSNSPTTLNDGNMLDISLALPVYKAEAFNLSGVLGFRHDHWHWEDHGGYYIYSSSGGFRDNRGTFDNAIGLTYEQWFYAPYVGLEASGAWNNIGLSARVAGTKWAWADDVDHHLARDLMFEDSFNDVTFLSAGTDISYPLTKSLSLMASFDYQHYFRKKGDTVMNAVDFTSSGAGTSHQSWLYSLKLGYAF